MKPLRLRTKLTLAFLMIALFSFALVGLFANVLLGSQFERYTLTKLNQTIETTVEQVTAVYTRAGSRWDAVSLDEAGMNLLTDGLILRVADETGAVVWNAREHNNGMCMRILENMAQNMQSYQADFQGGYEEKSYPALVNGKTVGEITVGYYGPYFYSEADLQFLSELNRLLLVAAAISLAGCLLLGAYLARRLSTPIDGVIRAAEQIAAGDYSARIPPASGTAEIEALSRSVNSIAESLALQESLRKRLTADVAHELRTPLTTLQSTVEAMLDGVWEPSEEHLGSCREEILRLGKLVDQLSTLSRFDGEQLALQRESFDLSALAAQIAGSFESAARQKGVSLTISGEATPVFADRDKLGQVLINLISNALKFTSGGGRIAVETENRATEAILLVRDTGAGIAPEHVPFIFERFYRADASRSRETGGAGIGLSIVDAIVRAHGGSVRVQSTPGEGSAFIVSLPKTESAAS